MYLYYYEFSYLIQDKGILERNRNVVIIQIQFSIQIIVGLNIKRIISLRLLLFIMALRGRRNGRRN